MALSAHGSTTLTPVSARRKQLLIALFVFGAMGAGSVALAARPAPPERNPGRRATGHERRFDRQRAFSDLRRQVEIGPRPSGSPGNRREVRLIVHRLRAAGLEPRVQQPFRNVVATIPGRGRGTVLLGAHHDTKDIPGFVGANDGASGVAVLLELARVLPNPNPGPSVTLAFFDGEEAPGSEQFSQHGDRGSRQFVRFSRRSGRRQGAPALAQIRAMYLLDMVGDCSLQIPREASSDRDLYRRLKGPAFGGTTGQILDDHTPFEQAGIPAVDVIDFSYGPGGTPGAWWHTTEDSLDKVCPASLGQVGGAVESALGTL
jgi:glutaminyl-peptide cyclotransferase